MFLQHLLNGITIGGSYALIALGYTLVYGVLKLINFAHGEVMMIGCFGGYFVFEVLNAIPAPGLTDPNQSFLNAQPIISVILAFIVGMGVAAAAGPRRTVPPTVGDCAERQ